jgi:uncharacterized membrane protein YdjX (TVP38/TMEM64 family)
MNATTSRWLWGLVLLALVGVAVALRGRFDAAALQAWVEGAGAAGPLVFVALYAAATVLFLPGAVVTLAGGALFGPLWGTLWNLAGATLGALIAFLIARRLGAGWVARRAGPRLRSLNEGVSAEGWRFVAFVRLVPLFPFNLLNYALGLTRIPLPAYVLASAIFMLPGAMAYTWLGYAGREALAGGEGMLRNILIALALVSTLAFLPRLIRRLRGRVEGARGRVRPATPPPRSSPCFPAAHAPAPRRPASAAPPAARAACRRPAPPTAAPRAAPARRAWPRSRRRRGARR